VAWTAPVDFAEPQIVDETDLNLMQDNIRQIYRLLGYTEFTADVSTTTHTEAAPLDIVSAGAITYLALPIVIEFYCPALTTNAAGAVNLWDATTDLGRLTHATSLTEIPVKLERHLTPTAASHTYKIRIWQTGGSTSRARAGAGGAGVLSPGHIAIWQKGG
jgi:hypothetical protein